MSGQITLNGLQLGYYNDGTTWRSVENIGGWYDSPKLRTSYTARPYAAGAYYAPAYQEPRTITLTGRVAGKDGPSFIAAKRQLGGLCNDPVQLYNLQVDDDAGSLFTQVQRSADVLYKQQGPYAADFSLSLTAPDPRLLALNMQSISTPMAQSGAGGIQWNGPGVTNLLQNPGFESGSSPWTVTGGTFTLSVSRPHMGIYAAQVTPNGTSGSVSLTSEKEPVQPGQQITASAWVWCTNAVTSNFSVSVNWYNASSTLLSTSSSFTSVTAQTYTQVSNTFTAPAGAAFAAIVPTLSGTPPSTQVWYLDDAMLHIVTGVQWNGPTPGTTGVQWGQPASTGVVRLDNTLGTAPADVVATITGPAQNPAISTSTNWIIYNGTLSASDVLVINTGTGSVLLNGVNRRPYLTRADWFTIPPASTLDVRFTCGVQNPTASMTASWRTSYV